MTIGDDHMQKGDGSWVTINGTPVFIEHGQSIGDAVNAQFHSDLTNKVPPAGTSIRLVGGIKGEVVNHAQVPQHVRDQIPSSRINSRNFWVHASTGNYMVAHVRDIVGTKKSADEEKGERKGAIRKLIDGILELVNPGDERSDDTVLEGLETIDKGFQAVAGDRVAVRKSVPIVKIDAEERLVYGVVYEPNVDDTHGDAMTAAEIRKACHGFMERYATLEGDTGTDHLSKAGRHQLPIVENFLAPVGYTLGKQQITPGTWVMVARARDDQLWADVKAGRYTGWSFEGFGRRVAA